jgi:hypothetical protein
MNYIGDVFNTKEVHLVGGSLCEHITNDYDVAVGITVHCDSERSTIISIFENKDVFSDFEIHASYPDETDNPYRAIVVTTYEGRKVDFLFYFIDDYSIDDVLDEFPLSIQMQAMDSKGNHILGKGYDDDPITIFIPGKSENKYRGYYPDKEFIYAHNIKSGERITGVQEA